MADEGITFETLGTGVQAPTTGGGQEQPRLSNSFAERAAKIKERMASGQTPAPGGAPNRATAFNQATLQNLSDGRAPQTDIPASDYAKMSWGEYAPIVASNVLPSSWEAIKGIGNAAIHPIDTATAIGEIGKGLGSKAVDAAGNAVGYGPVLDPSKKAEREAIADALLQSYSGRYGGGEEGEFWKHLAEDPASYLSDAATVLSGGAGTAAKLGIIEKAGNIAKYGSLARNLDPIQAAITATGKAAPVVGRAVPYGAMIAQSVVGGVPFQDLKMARQIALSGDPEKMGAFTSALKGNPKFSGEAADAYEKALGERMVQASADYMTDRATAFGRTQPVDLTGAQIAREDLNNMINRVSPAYGKRGSPYGAADTATAQEAIDAVDEIFTNPTAKHTIEGLDPEKKALDAIAERITNPTLRSRVYAIAGEMVNAMSDTDPAYGRMMKTWSDALADVRKARSEIGRLNTSDATKANRLNKGIRNNSRVLDMLEQTPSGQNLRYSMAGDAMKDWGGPRTAHIIGGMGGLGGVLWSLGHSPASALAAAPAVALSSPKIGALTQYGLGRAERAVNKAAGKAAGVLTYSPALTNVASQYGAAREEREGRKSGGRVSSHEADADQLVRAAERAKKGWSAKTEPLLNQSDEAVAKALEVANRSI